jgi:hypothetical protein
LKLPYLRASYTKSVGPIKFYIEIYLPRLLFFKTLRRLGAIFETPCIIREGKPLYPFLRARRSVRFGIVKVYVEKKCRKIKFMNNIQGVSKKETNS